MKNLIIIFLASVVFLGACQLLSSDNTTSPDIKIEPSPIIAGQEVIVSVSSSKEFFMPACDGITYEIEKLDSEGWEVFDGHYGPCAMMLKPEVLISEYSIINFTIDEEGTYRFVSSFKYNSEDEFKPIYSRNFEVASMGVMPL